MDKGGTELVPDPMKHNHLQKTKSTLKQFAFFLHATCEEKNPYLKLNLVRTYKLRAQMSSVWLFSSLALPGRTRTRRTLISSNDLLLVYGVRLVNATQVRST